MAVRTIGVKVTGADDVERVTRLVNNLQKSVVDALKGLGKLEDKGNKSSSFSFKIKVDASDFTKELGNLKAQMQEVEKKTKDVGNSSKESSAVIASSFRDIENAISSTLKSMDNLVMKAGKLTVVNPAKTMLSSFVQLNSEIVKMNLNLGKGLGQGLMNGLYGVTSQLRAFVSTTLNEVVKESQQLGDAMQIYRVNMEGLGFSPTNTNKSLKRLGDYGKHTVYDASDLLGMASSLYAYDRKDAEDIVKAVAGLTAQTANPVESMSRVNTQMTQILSAGVLNQQDWRYMREAFNALGASEVIKNLEALAKSKGYDSMVDATRNRAISSDEFLDIIKQVGSSDKFQNLVESIITPRQALANLKESLSNLFVFDDIDENGNAIAGPLKGLYDSITEGIKGITSVVNTDEFRNYVKRFGDGLGSIISSINKSTTEWSNIWGRSFIRSLDEFISEFGKSVSNFDYGPTVTKLSSSLQELLKTVGGPLGRFAGQSIVSITGLVGSLADVGRDLVSGGILDGLNGVIDMYKNIAELGVSSGAVKTFAEQFKRFYEVINTVLTDEENSKALKGLVDSFGKYFKEFFSALKFLGADTNLIPTILGGVQSLIEFFTYIIKEIRKEVKAEEINSAMSNIKEVWDYLLDTMKDIYVVVGSSVIKALASPSAKSLLKAIADFFIAMNKSFVRAVSFFGGSGGFEKGLTNLMNFFTTLVNGATSIVTVLGPMTFAIPLVNKLFSFVMALIRGSEGVLGGLQAMGVLSQGQNLAGLFGPVGKRSATATSSNTGSIVGGIAGRATIASLLVGMSTMVNQSVQNSDANQQTKDLTTALSGIFSGASSGAVMGSMFGPWGAGIGGVSGGILGLIKGMYDIDAQSAERDRLLEEAKQVKQQQAQLEAQYAKELADRTRAYLTDYYSAITPGSEAKDDLGATVQYVQKMMAESGMSFMSTLAKSGIDLQESLSWLSDDDVISIKGQEQTIGELKSQLGLNEQEVVGAIQLLFKSYGESQVSIMDSAEGTYQTLNVLNDTAQAQVEEEMKRIKAMLKSVGIDSTGVSPARYGALYGELKNIEQGEWASQDDKAEAIRNAFATFDGNLGSLLNSYTTEKILGMSQQILDKSPEITNTPEETKAKAKKTYSDFAKSLDKGFDEIVEGKSQQAVEEINKLIPEVEKVQKNAKAIYEANEMVTLIKKAQEGFATALKSDYITKLQEGIDSGKIKEGDGSRMLLDSALEEMGVTTEEYRKQIIDKIFNDGLTVRSAIEETKAQHETDTASTVESVKQANLEYVNAIGMLYSKGIITIDEAKAGLGSINFNNIDTNALGTEGQNLYNEVKGGIDESSGRLKQAELVVDKDYTNAGDIEKLKENVSSFWDKLVNIANNMWDSITGAFSVPSARNPVPNTGWSFGNTLGSALFRSSGGPVGGNYLGFSKGSDTIPAMLTPGEYVLRRKAVESLGTGFLSNLNKNGVQALQKLGGNTIINNVYNTNNAKVSQNIDNKSQYLNGMYGLDRLMRYV